MNIRKNPKVKKEVASYYSPELITSIKDSEKEIATAKRYDDVEIMHKELFAVDV